MNISIFISDLNDLLAVPTAFLFLGTAFFLTLKTNFIQIRAFPRFLKILKGNLKEQK